MRNREWQTLMAISRHLRLHREAGIRLDPLAEKVEAMARHGLRHGVQDLDVARLVRSMAAHETQHLIEEHEECASP